MMESGEEEETGKRCMGSAIRDCTIARPPSAQITEIRRGRGRDRPGKKEDDDSNLAQGSGRSVARYRFASLAHSTRDTKQAPMPSRPLRPRTRTPTTDKVFLGTTPFPDVINAISCARPLSREGGRPPVAQSLPTPRTCLYDDVPASQGLKFYEKRIKQVIKSSGIRSDLASRLKSRNHTSIFF